MESLTYLCQDPQILLDLNDDLTKLLQKLRDKLPQEENLILRSSALSRVSNLKKKYAKIKARMSCTKLPIANIRGRKKANSRYRNRVGAKADRLKKVIGSKVTKIKADSLNGKTTNRYT